MSKTFQKEVLDKLSSIEERLSNIETRFEEATSFADSLMDGEDGLFGADGLSSIKDTLSTFLTPQMTGGVSGATDATDTAGYDADSLQELVGSLKSFKERLTGIKEAISDLPDETSNTLDKG